MLRGLILYHSKTGNVRDMASSIALGMRGEGLEVDIRKTDECFDWLAYNAIVIGSPTQYGTMAWEVKKILDESASKHYKLDGVVGGAFSSSAHVGGGNETTILDILHAMLIHGMVVQGEPMYDHYGATALTGLGGDTFTKCERYGSRIGKLVKRLNGQN
jgi:NAD(P)H dehydrogenase (quinone)